MYTQENYHSFENKHLSNSKMRDFLKSKEYFYKKHIAHQIEQKATPALILGSMVDTIVTSGFAAYKERFRVVARRNLKEPPVDHIEVTQAQHDEAIGITDAVIKSVAYGELADFKRQQIITVDYPIGQFSGICGMLDFLWVSADGTEASIVDLKTASNVDPRKYYWHALEYGYHNQMAMYISLVKNAYPQVTALTCYHLVVEKDPDGIYKLQTFIFPQQLLTIGEQENIEIVKRISKETEWKDDPVSFTTAIELKQQAVNPALFVPGNVEALPV